MLMILLSVLDIAVAAPYGGEDKRGLVYIYNGGANGLNTIPSQILEGQWAARTMPPSFGYSLKGATDVDKNGYPGPLLQMALYNNSIAVLPLRNSLFQKASCNV